MAKRSISSTVDEELFKRAMKKTGATQAETVRRALTHFLAVPARSMTKPQHSTSLGFLIKASDALGKSIVYLTREQPTASTAMKKQLRVVIPGLKADKAKIDARITALADGKLTMLPPTKATIDKISKLAGKVGTLTKTAQQADLVVSAINKVVEIWNGTQVAS